MKKSTLLIAAFMMMVVAVGCKKQQPPSPMPPQGTAAMPGGSPHGEMAPASKKTVVVPESVKKTWKAVKVEVEFKDQKTKKDFTVPLNSEFKVPGSDLVLKAGDFLPNFSMSTDQITSASDKPENPAIRMVVEQGGKEIFHGWLFAKFPTVHPFQHDKYGVVLLGGVRK